NACFEAGRRLATVGNATKSLVSARTCSRTHSWRYALTSARASSSAMFFDAASARTPSQGEEAFGGGSGAALGGATSTTGAGGGGGDGAAHAESETSNASLERVMLSFE